jgi:predicted helicase
MRKARDIFYQIGKLCEEIQQKFSSELSNSQSLQKAFPLNCTSTLTNDVMAEVHCQCGVLLTFSLFFKKGNSPKDHPYLKEFWRLVPEEIFLKLKKITNDADDLPSSEFEQFNLTEAGYPLFLSIYAEKIQKQMGVVYTPQWIADEIVRLVFLLLDRTMGGTTSAKKDALWYDPAAGMLNFEAALIKYLVQNKANPLFESDQYYWSDLNPVVLALGYFLLLEHDSYDEVDESEFQIISHKVLSSRAFHCESALTSTAFEKITEYLKQKSGPIVIMGNPPYSVSSSNRNDWIVDLMRAYAVKEPNITRLYDDYVKFIRLAHKLIEVHGHGIIAFITNRKFLDGKIFYGMRQALLNFFDTIYILDLFGDSRNVKDNEDSENVFGIQTGVAICIFVKSLSQSSSYSENLKKTHSCLLNYSPLSGKIENKRKLLQEITLDSTFISIAPKPPLYLFLPGPSDSPWQSLWENSISLPNCFQNSSRAMLSGRDRFMIHVDSEPLEENVQNLADQNYPILRKKGRIGRSYDPLLENPEIYRRFNFTTMKASIIPIVYRPFDDRHAIFYVINHRCGKSIILDHLNKVWDSPETIDLNDPKSSSYVGFNFVHSMQTPPFNHVLISRGVVDSGVFGYSTSKVAPLWYEGKVNLAENLITPFNTMKNNVTVAEIFGYLYGILSCSVLAEYFEPHLLHDFPRVLMPCCVSFFNSIAEQGVRLIQVHLFQFKASEKAEIKHQMDSILNHYEPKVQTDFQLDSFKYNELKANLTLYGKINGISKINLTSPIDPVCWNFHIGSIAILSHWLQGRKFTALERSWTPEEWNSFFSLIFIVTQTIRIRQNIDNIFLEHQTHFVN